jgi:hypothetical protein
MNQGSVRPRAPLQLLRFEKENKNLPEKRCPNIVRINEETWYVKWPRARVPGSCKEQKLTGKKLQRYTPKRPASQVQNPLRGVYQAKRTDVQHVSDSAQPCVRLCEVKNCIKIILELGAGGQGKSCKGYAFTPTKPNLLRTYYK